MKLCGERLQNAESKYCSYKNEFLSTGLLFLEESIGILVEGLMCSLRGYRSKAVVVKYIFIQALITLIQIKTVLSISFGSYNYFILRFKTPRI